MEKVYFTKEISSESLIKIYEKLERKLSGKVAVKISTGEAGNNHYLKPELINDLVKKLNGTIVECNTAYEGKRNTTKDHLETIKEHGFSNVDLMDRDGDITRGKAWIHSGGVKRDDIWSTPQVDFIESMAEADKSVVDYLKNIVYINVVNNLSVDCDCVADPEAPCMKDIGILASLDPVALDQACLDLIYNSDDEGKNHFIERVESRKGKIILKHAEELDIGKREYQLISID